MFELVDLIRNREEFKVDYRYFIKFCVDSQFKEPENTNEKKYSI